MLEGEAAAEQANHAGIGPETVASYLQIDLPRLLFWLRRGVKWIALAALIGLIAGMAYAKLAKPRYTVTTDILIDPSGLQIVSNDLFGQSEQKDALLLNVESKRQTLISGSVLLRAIEALDLEDDPEFVPPPSLLSSVRGLFGGGGTGVQRSPKITALETLQKRLTARRDERSFVVTMSVWTWDASKSIRVSEAIIKAFREELVAADTAGARRSVDALTVRIGELKDDVNKADEAVQAFRREHKLQSSQGELISSRSMSQINQQLVEARQRLIAAESRYRELSSSHAADAAATQSATIAALRAQYAALKSKVAAQSRVLGPLHPQVVQEGSSLSALQAEIDAEVKRVVLAAKNELEQARSNVTALETEAASAGKDVFTDNDAQVKLRELTRESSAKAAIYESFLLRAREISERQKLDTTNIRVISPAVLPKSRSWPPGTIQVGGFGAMAGMVLGILGVLGFGIASDMGHAPSPRILLPSREKADRRRRETVREPEAHKPPPAIAPSLPRNGRGGSLLNI
jgi:uncharacterized protein involved in exopolysaccharide biosynthesis